MEQVAVLDISSIGLKAENPTEEEYLEVGKSLFKAFSEIGFIHLTGHGVDQEGTLIKDAMSESKDFFLSPDDVKRKVEKGLQGGQGQLQGWVEQGREIFDQDEEGKVAVKEIRESFDISRINSEEDRFPDEEFPEFKKLFTRLAERSILLSHRILRSLSLTLGENLDYFSDLHTKILTGVTGSALRTIYYPGIEGDLPAGHIRCGEHSDYGTFTLLYQDQFPGLQVKSASGAWINADPVEGAVTVNIGDLLEMWTAGKFPATLHRVGVPLENDLRSKARQSIVFFIHPDDEVLVEPLTGPSPDYPSVTAGGHLKNRFAATYKF